MPEIVAIDDTSTDLDALLKDTPIANDEQGAQSNPEESDKAAADAAALAEQEAQAAADEAAAQAEADKKAQEEADRAIEGRKRIYTGHLPAERQREIAIAAQNPDMPLEQVRELAKGGEEEPEQRTTSARDDLAAMEERYAELDKDLAQCDKDFVRPVGEKEGDFDWDKAVAERRDLLLQITKLAPVVAQEEQAGNSYDTTWQEAEGAANELLPDLADEASDAFAACAGRTAQIVALKDANKPLPKVVIDGRGHVMDPTNPNFPYLVAHEQAQKLGIVDKAPVAKPGATEAKPVVKRLSPVPAGQSQNATKLAPVEGQRTKPTLQERAAGLKTMADLDKFLAEPDDDSQGFALDGRRQLVID